MEGVLRRGIDMTSPVSPLLQEAAKVLYEAIACRIRQMGKP